MGRFFRWSSTMLLALAMSWVAGMASAAEYPNRPITLLVGYAPGGGTDIVARALAQELSARLGQSVVVDNKPGAATHIATQTLIRAEPDGYTLYLGTNATAINAVTAQAGNYDLLTDLTPISLVTVQPFALVVRPTLPVTTLQELIDYGKRHPTQLNVGLSASGNSQEVAARLFAEMTDIDWVLVPYKGAAPAIADLIGGRTDLMFTGLLGLSEHVSSGKLRLLALTGATRNEVLPEVPTVAEGGKLDGYATDSWQILYGPKGMPEDVLTAIRSAYKEVVDSGALQKIFGVQGMQVLYSDEAETLEFLKKEVESVKRVLNQ